MINLLFISGSWTLTAFLVQYCVLDLADLQEISSITSFFSLRQYSNMPWINTGSIRGSPVGVTLKGLTLWLPSWCEGLERLPTFNIWTSRSPPHHTILLNTSSYTQPHTHTFLGPHTCLYLPLLHIHHAPSRLNPTERLGLLALS